jgi:transposase
MLKVDQVVIIRHKVLVEGRAIRDVARELGLSRNTVRRYLDDPAGGGGAPKRRGRPKMQEVGPRIDAIMEAAKNQTNRKQRLTGTAVHKQLVGEGVQVGTTTVRAYLAEKRRRAAEVYIPLVHRPGESAQVDFFEVTVDVAGERQVVQAFLMSLPYSDRDFGWLYEHADLAAFLDGHARAFAHFGGVPRRLVYDNPKIVVDRIVGGERVLNTHFQKLVAHYLFEPSFARLGQGHDKGVVESHGKRTRLWHLTPIPAGTCLSEINTALVTGLDAGARTRRNIAGRSVLERFAEEAAAMLPLPEVAFEPRLPAYVEVGRQATARLGGAVYSLPSHWARSRAMAWVGATDVRFEQEGETVIAGRQRKGGRSIQYLHYLPELAKKPQAVRQVAPELLAELGEPWATLWRQLVAAHDEARAAKIMAGILGALVTHGQAAMADSLSAVLAAPVPVLPESPPARVAVPDRLAGYTVDAARAVDYDPILCGGRP